MTKKKAPVLPTNDAIFLYFWSLRPPLAVRDLDKITQRLSVEGRDIAMKILYNTNPNYRKLIPECTNMERYCKVERDIDTLLNALPLYAGGSEAVMGYFKYAGVLTQAGVFRKGK